jgi:hypothetical protein
MFFLMVLGDEICLTLYVFLLLSMSLFFKTVSRILLLLVDIIEGGK